MDGRWGQFSSRGSGSGCGARQLIASSASAVMRASYAGASVPYRWLTSGDEARSSLSGAAAGGSRRTLSRPPAVTVRKVAPDESPTPPGRMSGAWTRKNFLSGERCRAAGSADAASDRAHGGCDACGLRGSCGTLVAAAPIAALLLVAAGLESCERWACSAMAGRRATVGVRFSAGAMPQSIRGASAASHSARATQSPAAGRQANKCPFSL